jgi:hypothetical protein
MDVGVGIQVEWEMDIERFPGFSGAVLCIVSARHSSNT